MKNIEMYERGGWMLDEMLGQRFGRNCESRWVGGRQGLEKNKPVLAARKREPNWPADALGKRELNAPACSVQRVVVHRDSVRRIVTVTVTVTRVPVVFLSSRPLTGSPCDFFRRDTSFFGYAEVSDSTDNRASRNTRAVPRFSYTTNSTNTYVQFRIQDK